MNAWRIMLLLATIGALAACARVTPTKPTDAAVMFEIISAKPDDRIEYAAQDGGIVFDIYSPSGISSARVKQTAGETPKQITLNFHLRGLEHLKFSFADQSVEIEIPSHGVPTPHESVPPDNPLYMPVKIVSQGDAYPIENGYIQVQLPRAFYDSGAREFTIEWIDFYR